MSGRILGIGLTVLLLSLLLGCTHSGGNPRGGQQAGRSISDPRHWIALAEAYRAAGDLAQALYHYRVARVLTPVDPEVVRAIEQLQSAVGASVSRYYRQGRRALERGESRQAREALLRVLALAPDHAQALAGLRQLETEKSRRAMARKVRLARNNEERLQQKQKVTNGYAEEAFAYSRQSLLQPRNHSDDTETYAQDLEKHLARYPDDQVIRQRLFKVRMALAERAYANGLFDVVLDYLKSAEALAGGDRKTLAATDQQRRRFGKQLYSNGLRVYRSDTELAARYWQYALKFDPGNEKIRLRLDRAATAE